MEIRPGDFSDPQVLDLLAIHLAGMHANSPPGTCHVLDLSGLQTPEISFWTAWRDDDLLGCGAIKELDARTGELKSMRTADAHLRQGVAAALLDQLIGIARERGYTRLCLETGTGDAFEAALALYRRGGFRNGAVFADYEVTDFNQFLHLDL
jgi:putative acetyltransferase